MCPRYWAYGNVEPQSTTIFRECRFVGYLPTLQRWLWSYILLGNASLCRSGEAGSAREGRRACPRRRQFRARDGASARRARPNRGPKAHGASKAVLAGRQGARRGLRHRPPRRRIRALRHPSRAPSPASGPLMPRLAALLALGCVSCSSPDLCPSLNSGLWERQQALPGGCQPGIVDPGSAL